MRGMSSNENPGLAAARAAFPSAMDAKTFLAERIAAQAEREGAPLDELERKNLYFSETYEAPDDALEVASEFGKTHDDAEYEKKIAALAKRAYKADEGSATVLQRWREAMARLEPEDHYIEIMLEQAGLMYADYSLRAPNYTKELYGTLAVVVVVATCIVLWATQIVSFAGLLPKAVVVGIVGAIVWFAFRTRRAS
jgi:hypothetical protein